MVSDGEYMFHRKKTVVSKAGTIKEYYYCASSGCNAMARTENSVIVGEFCDGCNATLSKRVVLLR
jgi:hypothetical protein